MSEFIKIVFNAAPNDPQSYWKMIENKLFPIIDKLAPNVPFLNNITTKITKPNKYKKVYLIDVKGC